MKKFVILTASVLAMSLPATQLARADDAEMIKNAEAAAPAAVGAGATIYAPQADGSMKTLRESKNGFWCMPNDPNTPGNDPMCGDANSMEWAMAWMGKKDPPKGKVGLIYMLAGGTDASNTDPFATAPTADQQLGQDGPPYHDHECHGHDGRLSNGCKTRHQQTLCHVGRNALSTSHGSGRID